MKQAEVVEHLSHSDVRLKLRTKLDSRFHTANSKTDANG